MPNTGRDLFPELKPLKRKKAIAMDPFSFHRRIVLTLSYERMLLILLGAIILLTAVYMSGIDRGKKIASKPRAPEIQVAQVENGAAKSDEAKDDDAETMEAEEAAGYAVQLASYTSAKTAEEEAGGLRAKGYSAFTRQSGRFHIVLVGGYKDRAAAEAAAIKLQRKFKDCFVRFIGKREE